MDTILSEFELGRNECERISWLPINNPLEQLIGLIPFKFCYNTSLPYMNDLFKPAGQTNPTTRASLLKLSQPL